MAYQGERVPPQLTAALVRQPSAADIGAGDVAGQAWLRSQGGGQGGYDPWLSSIASTRAAQPGATLPQPWTPDRQAQLTDQYKAIDQRGLGGNLNAAVPIRSAADILGGQFGGFQNNVIDQFLYGLNGRGNPTTGYGGAGGYGGPAGFMGGGLGMYGTGGTAAPPPPWRPPVQQGAPQAVQNMVRPGSPQAGSPSSQRGNQLTAMLRQRPQQRGGVYTNNRQGQGSVVGGGPGGNQLTDMLRRLAQQSGGVYTNNAQGQGGDVRNQILRYLLGLMAGGQSPAAGMLGAGRQRPGRRY